MATGGRFRQGSPLHEFGRPAGGFGRAASILEDADGDELLVAHVHHAVGAKAPDLLNYGGEFLLDPVGLWAMGYGQSQDNAAS
jgi:hypothetical protein